MTLCKKVSGNRMPPNSGYEISFLVLKSKILNF